MFALNKSHQRPVKVVLLALYSAVALLFISAFNASAAGVPESVTGLTATAIDGASIGLSWNGAKDGDGSAVDHYRIYYGATSVQRAGTGEYGSTVDTSGSATSYIVGGLSAGTTYYFALTAVNGQGTESELYSQEASATTQGAAGAATGTGSASGATGGVSGAGAGTGVTPAEMLQINEIIGLLNNESGGAISGTGGSTIPPVQNQAAGVVESDSAQADNPSAPAAGGAPTVTTVQTVSKNKVKVTFSEPVKLPTVLPEVSFKINAQANPLTELLVTGAMMDDKDPTGKTILVVTEDQQKDVNYVLTVGVQVTDASANAIQSGNQDSGLFAGTDQAEPSELQQIVLDTTPPEDVTNLLLSFKQQLDRFMVILDWKASINSAKDLMEQILYMSLDRGTTYDSGKLLGSAAVHTEVPNLEGGKEYTFKITTKDFSGNESVGVVKSIRLPQTGAAAGILILGSAALAQRFLKRRKQ